MATLSADVRVPGHPGTTRTAGQVPAVVYGPSIESMPLAVDRRALLSLFSKITRSSRIDMTIHDQGEETKMNVFVKTIDMDPVTDEPVHVDFYCPQAGHSLKLHVPVKYVGDPIGVKNGGVLNISFSAVRVIGLPESIPDLITIDVSELDLHDAIHVSDIDFGEAEPMLPPERVLAAVLAPRGFGAEEEEAEELEGEELEEGTEAGEGSSEPAAEGE